MSSRPWGKIFVILLMSAAVMGAFVWKYLDTMADKAGGQIAHVPSILEPFYNLLGEKVFLVLGAVAALLFAVVGLRAVAGRPDPED
jgi:hypothetical protein